MLKPIEDRGTIKVSVINPSINDYILSEISANTSEQVSIILSAQFIEQMMKMAKSPEATAVITEKIFSGDFLKVKTLRNSVFFYFLQLLTEWGIFDIKLRPSILLSVGRAYQNLEYSKKSEYANVICTILNSDFYNFYSLQEIFFDPAIVHFILEPMYLDDVEKVFNELIGKIPVEDNLYFDLIKTFKEMVVEKISESVQEAADNDLPEIASNAIGEYSEHVQGYLNETSNMLEDCVWDDLERSIISKLEDAIVSSDCRLFIDLENFSTSDMKYSFDISGALNAALQEDRDYDEDERPTTGISEWDQVKNMFER